MTIAELAELWHVSSTTARNYTRAEGFPTPVRLSTRTIRWVRSEVLAWLETQRSAERHRRRNGSPDATGAGAPVRVRVLAR